MKLKQILLLFVVLCLMLTGCGQSNVNSSQINSSSSQSTSNMNQSTPKTKKGNNSEAMGRYIEKGIPLPEGISSDSTFVLTKRNKLPYLLEANEKASFLKGYQLNKDGSWMENTPEWLKGLSLPEG